MIIILICICLTSKNPCAARDDDTVTVAVTEVRVFQVQVFTHLYSMSACIIDALAAGLRACGAAASSSCAEVWEAEVKSQNDFEDNARLNTDVKML